MLKSRRKHYFKENVVSVTMKVKTEKFFRNFIPPLSLRKGRDGGLNNNLQTSPCKRDNRDFLYRDIQQSKGPILSGFRNVLITDVNSAASNLVKLCENPFQEVEMIVDKTR